MNTKYILSFVPASVRFALCACLVLPGLACSDDGGDEDGASESETGDTETDTEDTETETEDSEGETEGETDGETEATGETLAIVGTYTDEYGDTHVISEESWENGAGSFAIATYDNTGMWIVAQNADSNEFFPGLWSRFDWTMDGDTLLYCQSAFDGATQADAEAASADPSDLMMGCGGFAWTNMTP